MSKRRQLNKRTEKADQFRSRLQAKKALVILAPHRQRVYVDTSALIYAFEAPPQYPRLQTHFLDLLTRGELTLVTSWITFAEVLVKPLQTGNTVKASEK